MNRGAERSKRYVVPGDSVTVTCVEDHACEGSVESVRAWSDIEGHARCPESTVTASVAAAQMALDGLHVH